MQKNIVVDSSVAVKWLNYQDERNVNKALGLLHDLRNEKIAIFMPELAKYEVGNALLNKKMKAIDSREALSGFYEISIYFFPLDEDQAYKSMNIALKHNMTFYDASFIALAEKLKATLITDNLKHQGKYTESVIKIIPLSKY